MMFTNKLQQSNINQDSILHSPKQFICDNRLAFRLVAQACSSDKQVQIDPTSPVVNYTSICPVKECKTERKEGRKHATINLSRPDSIVKWLGSVQFPANFIETSTKRFPTVISWKQVWTNLVQLTETTPGPFLQRWIQHDLIRGITRDVSRIIIPFTWEGEHEIRGQAICFRRTEFIFELNCLIFGLYLTKTQKFTQ